MDHLAMIEGTQSDKLHTFAARCDGEHCFFRAHYQSYSRTGRSMQRYIEVRCAAGEMGTWTYRSGYMYNDAPQFWSVPAGRAAACEAFAQLVTLRAAQALTKELDLIKSAAIRASIAIA